MPTKMTAKPRYKQQASKATSHFISYDCCEAPRIARLSDPVIRKQMNKTLLHLTRSKKAALAFLVEIGIATPTGRLSKRFGG